MNLLFRSACVALVVIGVAGFADDSVWMQQKSVAIGSANFQQCVTGAVAVVKGVSVNHAASASAAKVALEVKLDRPIPFLDAEVQHRGSNAVIVFSGRGDTEPDADNKALSPMLQSLADAIRERCVAGK